MNRPLLGWIDKVFVVIVVVVDVGLTLTLPDTDDIEDICVTDDDDVCRTADSAVVVVVVVVIVPATVMCNILNSIVGVLRNYD